MASLAAEGLHRAFPLRISRFMTRDADGPWSHDESRRKCRANCHPICTSSSVRENSTFLAGCGAVSIRTVHTPPKVIFNAVETATRKARRFHENSAPIACGPGTLGQ